MEFVACLAYLAALGVLSHLIGEALPRRWFDSNKRPFRSAGWERNGLAYERIGIRRWKDKAPDMSKFMPDMLPKRIRGRSCAGGADVERLVQETCVAEFIHAMLIVAGIRCLSMWPGTGGAVVTALWVAGNFPFILIQRYNRPRLKKLSARLGCHAVQAALTNGGGTNESFGTNLQYGRRT